MNRRFLPRSFHACFVCLGLALLAASPAIDVLADTAPAIDELQRPFVIRASDPLKEEIQVAVDPGFFARLRQAEAHQYIEVPVDGGRTVTLDLTRFEVIAPDARFVIGGPDGDTPIGTPSVVAYRGKVLGEDHSSAYLAVSERGLVNGLFESVTDRYTIGTPLSPEKSAERLTTIRKTSAFGELEVPFCGTEPGSGFDLDVERAKDAAIVTSAGPKLLYVAIDGDAEFVYMLGSTIDAADYIVQLIGAISAIYVRDLDLRLFLRFARLWPSGGEPFDPNDLYGFRTYWITYEDPSPYNLISMFSGRRDTPYGGVAYISNTCNGNGYCITAFLNGSFVAPVTYPDLGNWDVNVVAHEMGHNCGTYHTHDSNQYDPLIDNCGNGTPARGTIMSYCHTFQGYQRNIDLHMHRRIAETIRAITYSAGCHPFDCNGNGVDDAVDIAGAVSADVNSDGIPDECQDCNRNGILDPVDIAGGAPDVDGNGIPDECELDCNGNNLPDRYETWYLLADDADGNFVPDECDPDCNSNATLDWSEFQADLSLDLDRDRQLDQCQDCNSNFLPDWMDMDHQFNLFTGDRAVTGLSEFHAASGVVIATYGSGPVSSINDVLADPNGGFVYLSTEGGQVYRHTVGSGAVSPFIAAGSGGLGEPTGLLIAPSGDILVLDRWNAAVHRYDRATGAFLGTLVAPGAGGLGNPYGMTFNAGGTELLINGNPSAVYRYNAATGASLGVFVASGSGGLSSPRGMAILPNGNLAVASYGTNQILEYNGASGAFVRVLSDEYPLGLPWGLRIGPNGHLFVAGQGNVYEYFPDLGKIHRRFVRGSSALSQGSGLDFLPASPNDVNGNWVLDACEPGDMDADGVDNINDNCPATPNPAQTDSDGDGVGDDCDNCDAFANADQRDVDADGFGDACDNCPAHTDVSQADLDGDGRGDDCDNCASTPNPDQADLDGDAIGDLCDVCPDDPGNDADLDGLCADVDNCPTVFNPGQEDSNLNGVGDICEGEVFDTVATALAQLIVGSTGNFGNRATAGATLDFSLSGDCEAIYLYDGSPVVTYMNGGSPVAAFNLYGDDLLVFQPGKSLSVPTIDSGAFQVFRSADMMSADGKIGLKKIWYAPTHPDTAQFVLQRLRVYSADGNSYSGVTIGEFMDWDIPSGYNTGGFDASRKLVYQIGSGSGCEDNSQRQAGIALLGALTESGCETLSPFNALTQSNSTYVYPTGSLVPSEIRALMQTSGYSALGSSEDQFTFMTYYSNASLAPGDTLDIVVALVAKRASSPLALTAVVDQALEWFTDHFGCVSTCCVLRGDVNDDTKVIVSDLTFLVNYLFKGGAAPSCMEHGDVNGDAKVIVSDLTFLVNYLFKGGPAPVPCP